MLEKRGQKLLNTLYPVTSGVIDIVIGTVIQDQGDMREEVIHD